MEKYTEIKNSDNLSASDKKPLVVPENNIEEIIQKMPETLKLRAMRLAIEKKNQEAFEALERQQITIVPDNEVDLAKNKISFNMFRNRFNL